MLEFAVQWLTLRRGARLVVDGLIVLAVGGVVYMGWTLWYSFVDPFDAQAAGRGSFISVMFSFVYSLLHYLGLTLVVVGCARIIADGRDTASTEPRRTIEESTQAHS